jgi:hypothetical protein
MSNVITQTAEKPLQILTAIAAGFVTARRFVDYTGGQCGARGVKARGVAMYEAVPDASMAIIMNGTALVTSGEALVDQDAVTTDAYGRAVKALSGEHINGIVLNGQPLIGRLVEIQLTGEPINVGE